MIGVESPTHDPPPLEDQRNNHLETVDQIESDSVL